MNDLRSHEHQSRFKYLTIILEVALFGLDSFLHNPNYQAIENFCWSFEATSSKGKVVFYHKKGSQKNHATLTQSNITHRSKSQLICLQSDILL